LLGLEEKMIKWINANCDWSMNATPLTILSFCCNAAQSAGSDPTWSIRWGKMEVHDQTESIE